MIVPRRELAGISRFSEKHVTKRQKMIARRPGITQRTTCGVQKKSNGNV
jgi:hypothetical protein